MLDSLGCEALVANHRPCPSGRLAGDEVFNPYDEQMNSTPFGDARPAARAGLVAPQDIEIDRGSHGRVRGEGGD